MAAIRTRYDAYSGKFTVQDGQNSSSGDDTHYVLNDFASMDLDSLSDFDYDDSNFEVESE